MAIRKTDAGTWRAQWKVKGPDGWQSRSKNFRLRADAVAYLARVNHETASGAHVDRSAGTITFGAFVTAWLDTRIDLRAATLESMRGVFARHVLPTLGHRPLLR